MPNVFNNARLAMQYIAADGSLYVWDEETFK